MNVDENLLFNLIFKTEELMYYTAEKLKYATGRKQKYKSLQLTIIFLCLKKIKKDKFFEVMASLSKRKDNVLRALRKLLEDGILDMEVDEGVYYKVNPKIKQEIMKIAEEKLYHVEKEQIEFAESKEIEIKIAEKREETEYSKEQLEKLVGVG